MTDAMIDEVVKAATEQLDASAYVRSDLSDTEYHARPEISSSDIKLLADNPAKWRYQQDMPPADRPQFAFGRLFHAVTLEPHTVDDRFEVVNASTRTTKLYKDAVKANRDRTVVLQSEHDTAKAMREAVMACQQIYMDEMLQ